MQDWRERYRREQEEDTKRIAELQRGASAPPASTQQEVDTQQKRVDTAMAVTQPSPTPTPEKINIDKGTRTNQDGTTAVIDPLKQKEIPPPKNPETDTSNAGVNPALDGIIPPSGDKHTLFEQNAAQWKALNLKMNAPKLSGMETPTIDISKELNRPIQESLDVTRRRDDSVSIEEVRGMVDSQLKDISSQYSDISKEDRGFPTIDGVPMPLSGRLNPDTKNLDNAENILRDAETVLNAPKKGSNFATSFLQGGKDVVTDTDFWTLGLSSIVEFAQIRPILTKYDNGETLTPSEEAVLSALAVRSMAEFARQGDISAWYTGGSIAAEAVPFMAQFAATGGISNAAVKGTANLTKRAITKFVRNKLVKELGEEGAELAISAGKKKVLNAIGNMTVGTLVRTPLMPSTYANVTRQITPTVQFDGKGGYVLEDGKSLPAAIADSFIEVASESSGQLINIPLKALGRVLSGTRAAQKIMSSPIGDLGRRFTGSSIGKISAEIRKMGYDGFLEEMGEEYLGELTRLATGVNSVEEWNSFMSADNQLSMMIGFLPMTIMSGGANVASRNRVYRGYNNAEKALDGFLAGNNLSSEQISAVKNQISNTELSDLPNSIIGIVNSIGGLDGEVINERGQQANKLMVDYVGAKVRKDALDQADEISTLNNLPGVVNTVTLNEENGVYTVDIIDAHGTVLNHREFYDGLTAQRYRQTAINTYLNPDSEYNRLIRESTNEQKQAAAIKVNALSFNTPNENGETEVVGGFVYGTDSEFDGTPAFLKAVNGDMATVVYVENGRLVQKPIKASSFRETERRTANNLYLEQIAAWVEASSKTGIVANEGSIDELAKEGMTQYDNYSNSNNGDEILYQGKPATIAGIIESETGTRLANIQLQDGSIVEDVDLSKIENPKKTTFNAGDEAVEMTANWETGGYESEPMSNKKANSLVENMTMNDGWAASVVDVTDPNNPAQKVSKVTVRRVENGELRIENDIPLPQLSRSASMLSHSVLGSKGESPEGIAEERQSESNAEEDGVIYQDGSVFVRVVGSEASGLVQVFRSTNGEFLDQLTRERWEEIRAEAEREQERTTEAQEAENENDIPLPPSKGESPEQAVLDVIQGIRDAAPKQKNGEVDYDALLEENPEDFAVLSDAENGVETTVEDLRIISNNIGKKIASGENALKTADSPNKRNKVRREVSASKERKTKIDALINERYTGDALEETMTQVDNLSLSDRIQALDKIIDERGLFSNVRVNILRGIAGGDYVFLWKGDAFSHGLAAELGLSDSDRDRKHYRPLLRTAKNNGTTPEKLAEQIGEELGIEDTNDIRSEIIDVLGRVNSRTKAVEELEALTIENGEWRVENVDNIPLSPPLKGETPEQTAIGGENVLPPFVEEEDPFGIPFQVEESVNNRFNEELQQQIDGTLPVGHVYQLGMPSPVLRAAGIPVLPIELSAERLENKSKQENHPFDLSGILNLPQAIQNPIAVFDSTKKNGTTVVLTELKDSNGNNFVAAIRVAKDASRRTNQIEINDIRSLYPKDNVNGVLDWINGGLLKWVNKEKASAFLEEPRSQFTQKSSKKTDASETALNLPSVQSTNLIGNGENTQGSLETLDFIQTQSTNLIGGRDNTKSLSAAKIVQNFENPRLQVENNSFAPIAEEELNALVDRLMKTGLAKEVVALNEQAFLAEAERQSGQSMEHKGTVYGFVGKDNVVYLNKDKMNANTPIHEFAHLWNAFTKENNPELYARGTELIKQSPYWAKVNQMKAYRDLSEDRKIDEALAMAIGDKGAMLINERGLGDKLMEWLNDVWAWIAETLGIQGNIQDMTLEEFTDRAVADLLGGRRIENGEWRVENNIPLPPSKGELPEQTIVDVIREAEVTVDTNPSEAQKEAGNYRKGHVNIQGFDITIEQPKGSTRSGTDENGKEWSVEMQNTYGYFKRSEGKDGDHIDVFLGGNPESETVFVVDQVNPNTREFDEHKVMFGFGSMQEATDAYLSNYEDGWTGLGSITAIEVEDFREWLNSGKKRIKPFSEYKQVQEAAHSIENGKLRIENDSKDNEDSGNLTAENVPESIEISGIRAATYFGLNPDRLPLTLAVFERVDFKAMRGKNVKPITVQQMLNKEGIKQIEKTLINNVIESNFKDVKTVLYDEVEALVRASIMPLERIHTESYASYGKENLGDDIYGEEKTVILNAPVEHGVTGHFYSDFNRKNREDINYVPKQLSENVWVAVEDGYQDSADENNIYQYVGTAGTKEAVDAWIDNYNNSEFDNVNVGMFGHIRVWHNGDEFYLAELQSDFFQKNNARKKLIEDTADFKEFNEKLADERTQIGFDYVSRLSEVEAIRNEKMAAFIGGLNGFEFEMRDIESTAPELKLIKDGVVIDSKSVLPDAKEEEIFKIKHSFWRKIVFSNHITRAQQTAGEDIEIAYSNKADDLREERDRKLKEISKRADKKREEIYKTLSLEQKQFIASQKEWEKRLLREAIKEAAVSGSSVLRLPTPHTISVIEGYVSESAPYEIVDAQDYETLSVGDVIDYGGERYIVVNVDIYERQIEVASARNSEDFYLSDYIDEYADGELGDVVYSLNSNIEDIENITREEAEEYQNYGNYSDEVGNVLLEGFNGLEDWETISFYDYQDAVREEIRNAIDHNVNYSGAEDYFTQELGAAKVAETSDGKMYVWREHVETERFNQPSEYSDTAKDDFSIDDLDETQQTVARKYEELGALLETERGSDNFSVITDENGYDWYETSIESEEANRPVVAFQVIEGKEEIDSANSELKQSEEDFLTASQQAQEATTLEEVAAGAVAVNKAANKVAFDREMLIFKMEDTGERLNELTPINKELADINPSTWEKFIRNAQDEDDPVRRMQENIKSIGGTVDDYSNIYDDKNHSHGRATTLIEKFNKQEYKGMLDAYRAIRISGELLPLNFSWKKTGKPLTNQEKISVYLQAKDIQEAKEMELPDRGEQGFMEELGISHTDYISQFEEAVKKERVDNLHKAIKNATRYSLDLQKQYGLISKEAYDEYVKRDYYVPERGWQERDMVGRDTYYLNNKNAGGSNPYNAAMVRAKGRTSLASDPVAYITSIAHSTVLSAEKNKTKQVALNFVMRNLRLGRENGLFGFDRVWYVETGEKAADGNPIYKEVYTRPEQSLFDEGKVRTEVNDAYKDRRTDAESEQHRVVTYVNGSRYVVWFADERVANAINRNTEKRDIGKIENANRKITRYLSGVMTQYNPSFALWNLARDGGLALSSNWMEYGLGFTAQFTKTMATPGVQGALLRYVRTGNFKGTEYGQMLSDFFDDGAATGYSFLKDIDQLQKNFAKEMERSRGGEISANVIQGLPKAFAALTEYSELLVRFSQYVSLRNAGKTRFEATTGAKNISVNFNRKGAMRFGASFYAFWDANVQGVAKTLNLAYNHKGKFALLGGLLAAGGFINTLFSPDDPDEERAWGEYDRMTNIVIGDYRLPLPHVLRIFWGAGVQAALSIKFGKDAGEAAFDATSFALQDLLPVDLPAVLKWDEESNSVTADKYGLAELAPTSVRPFVDVLTNRTFTGAKVHPEPFMRSQDGTIPQAFLGRKDVSPILQEASNMLLEFGGGDRNAKTLHTPTGKVNPIFDVNPSNMQHLLKGYTGGVGSFLVDMQTTISNAIEGEFDPTTVPVLNRAYKPYQSEKLLSKNKYNVIRKVKAYENFVSEHEKSIKAARKEGDQAREENLQNRLSEKKSQEAIYKEAKRTLDNLKRDEERGEMDEKHYIKRLSEINGEW